MHTTSRPEEDCFLASADAIKHFFQTMARYNGKCSLCRFCFDRESFDFFWHGHAVRISLSCAVGHSLQRSSSTVISGTFTVNLK